MEEKQRQFRPDQNKPIPKLSQSKTYTTTKPNPYQHIIVAIIKQTHSNNCNVQYIETKKNYLVKAGKMYSEKQKFTHYFGSNESYFFFFM